MFKCLNFLSSKNSSKNGTVALIKHELVRDKLALFSFIFITALLLFLLASWFFIDANAVLHSRLDLTRLHQPPSNYYWLGTDHRGRDGVAMLIIATRNTLAITFLATAISSVFGIAYGLISGYIGGIVDQLMSSVIDIITSIPSLIAMLLLINFWGGSFTLPVFILVLSVLSWTSAARVIRTRVIQEKSREYVIASKTLGTKHFKIMFKKIIPNLSTIIITSIVLNAVSIIIVEAGIAFLNFQASFVGGPLPSALAAFSADTPTLGTLLVSTGYTHILRYRWWRWVPATVVIVLLMFSINIIGNMLNRVADKEQR